MSFIMAIFIGGGLAIIVTIIEEYRIRKLNRRLDEAHSKLNSLNFQYPKISRIINSIYIDKERDKRRIDRKNHDR